MVSSSVPASTRAARARVVSELAFGAVSVALLLDVLRRYTATSAIALVGTLSPLPVALLALLPFVLQVPAVAALSRRSPRRAAIGTAGVFVLTARTAPFVSDTPAVIVLAGIGCLAGATLLSLLISSRAPGAAAVAPELVALGLIIDVARRALLGTLDLAELPGAAGPLVAAIEGAVFLVIAGVALRGTRTWAAPSFRGPLALALLPLALAIAELAATSGWRAAVASGLGLADAYGLRATAVGTLAITLGLALGSSIDGRAARPLAAASLVVGAAIVALRVPILSLAGGALLACGLVLSLQLLRGADEHASLSPVRVAALLAVGWIGYFAVTLAYYALYAFTPVLWAAVGVLAVSVLASRERPPASWTLRAAAGVAVAAALAMILSTSEARPVAPTATLRILTYNIHFGFDHRQTPSLDAIAETIEAASPDVVVLQEVMRGSSLALQHDALGWLAGRLGMRYVFAPTIGDFFGNAVLTRVAIDDHEAMAFIRPAPLRHSPRGALLVRVAGVDIVVTHLDEYVDAAADAVREDQVRAMLDQWGGRAPPLVIAGDLNATPDSDAIALLTAAGFRDLAADAGATLPVLAPTRRIDYVFAKGISAASARVLTSAASDHRAVVVDLVLPAR